MRNVLALAFYGARLIDPAMGKSHKRRIRLLLIASARGHGWLTDNDRLTEIGLQMLRNRY